MKSLIKKAAVSLFVFSSLAIAASFISKEEVNQKVEQILAPFNNATSAMAVRYTELNIDSVRALDFGMNALIAKTGTENKLVLKLQNASYHYGNGTAPTMKANVSFQLNLVKAMGQTNLNNLGKDLDIEVKNIVKGYARKYGKAGALDVGVDELNNDAQGNFESAKLHLYAKVDLNNLPENLKIEDVEIKGFRLLATVNKAGFNAKITVVLNPQFKYFEQDEPGLKEYIEKLLNEDPSAYQKISDAIDFLDKTATRLVNEKSSEQ